jgi:hypothetical protein
MPGCTPENKGDLRMLDPKRIKLRVDAFSRLQLEIGFEERHGPVRAVRSLPLTQPEKFISLQDDENEEVGVIPDLAELDPESRRAVEEDLGLYYLKAAVTAIRKVESKNGIISWELDTNLGAKRVHIRDRQHIRPLPNGCTVLTDIHGAKYEIPPFEKLDEKSRHWLETEL